MSSTCIREILNPLCLKTNDDRDVAILKYRQYINDVGIDIVIQELLSEPILFEYAVSVSDAPWCQLILDTFHQDPPVFFTSPCHAILERLAHFLAFIPHSFSTVITQRLQDYWKGVVAAPTLVSALSEMDFSAIDMVPLEEDEEQDHHFVGKMKSQARRMMKARRRPQAVSISAAGLAYLHRLGQVKPSSVEQRQEIISAILQDQKSILKFFLEVLREPDVAITVYEAFIQTVEPSSPTSPEVEQSNHEVKTASMEPQSSAYPMVQPMKAALYFDSVEGFGDWRVYVSTSADRDLRTARRNDPSTFKIIIKKIKELSKGHFSDSNQKRLSGLQIPIPIYEAKITRDRRLVYQVDCMPEYDSRVHRQVLKIYGIYTHAQLDRKSRWDSIGRQLGQKGADYRLRCNFRNPPRNRGDNVFSPATFPPLDEVTTEGEFNPLELPREDLDEVHSFLVLEKFVTLSQALLNSIIANEDVQHVFAVSPREQEIIEHRHSCFVLGRSGTGKTTTMMFKILGIERAWSMQSDSHLSKPRQIFVTKSRVLAEKVNEYFSSLLKSLVTASYSLEDMARMAKSAKSQAAENILVPRDDEQNWRNDIPAKYSELADEHFPLFITFDHLCQMLEADFAAVPETFGSSPSMSSVSRNAQDGLSPPSLQLERRQISSSIISYDMFLESYWPHFPQPLTKGLNSSLVFSEFMGVIKGSENALMSSDHFIDEETYMNLSHRSQSTFSTQREPIYSLFKSYLKQKKERADRDAADRTHALLQFLAHDKFPGQKIDYLYVDEAQDNLLIDAMILRSLCRNPNGLFWAGDTAQTISVGSSFRFNDLKAFLFRIEEKNQPVGHEQVIPPKTFQLAINYRSHGGIVKCAHSIIELITHFWPNAIDILAREKGVVDGLRPVFLSGYDQDSVRYEQFLFGTSGSQIEFGAQQCILVRDDAARNKLREEVGDIGLILTLYESKGLEFNDVLLYNFFQDSTVDLSQWRVVLNQVSDRKRLVAPRFDEFRHAGICSELKFLYVAITRARKNMWIVDCSEKSEPMRIFWTDRELIQICTPGTDVPHLAVSSTPEEWAQSGNTLFQNKRYLQAKHCFERASLPRQAAIASAYMLREDARAIPVDTKNKNSPRHQAMINAAKAFLRCAADMGNGKQTKDYFRAAAGCYLQVDDKRKAAELYIKSEDFTQSAKLYRQLGLMDEAVDTIKKYESRMDKEVVARIIEVARFHYFNKDNIERASELFTSSEESLEFTELYDLDVARSTLLENMARFEDAGNLHLEEGRVVKAIEVYLKDVDNERCVHKANECILSGLWHNLSFGVTHDVAKSNSDVRQLLEFTEKLNPDKLKPADRDELQMFNAIVSGNMNRLQDLCHNFFRIHDDKRAALLCLDFIFSNVPRLQALPARDAVQVLDRYLLYARLLREVASTSEPCNDPTIQKLFGFYPTTKHVFCVRSGTLFHRFMLERPRYQVPGISASEEGVQVYEYHLSLAFKEVLLDRLRDRVESEDKICRQSQAVSPCLSFVVSGQCHRNPCPEEHIHKGSLNPAWYLDRIRFHFQQILIVHTLQIVGPRPLPGRSFGTPGMDREQLEHRFWLNRLYEAIFPPVYFIGTAATLTLLNIPEAAAGIHVVKDWVRNLLDTFKVDTRTKEVFLTMFTRLAKLSFFFDKVEAGNYVYRAPHAQLERSPSQAYLWKNGDQDVYVVSSLFNSLEACLPESILTGILSLRHIVTNRLTIDTSVLCDVIDHICGLLVVVVRCKLSGVPNVTLPRSWLLSIADTTKDGTHYLTSRPITMVFMETMATLIKDIMWINDGNALDYLRYGHDFRDLPRLGRPIRNVFITRICRAICLLGYNISGQQLRDGIVQAMKPLWKADRLMYSKYASCNNWQGLSPAVRDSTTASQMDEMIQVCHRNMQVNGSALPNVRRIIVDNLRDVRPLFGNPTHHILLGPRKLRADARIFVPKIPFSSASNSSVPHALAEQSQIGLSETDVGNSNDDEHAAVERSVGVKIKMEGEDDIQVDHSEESDEDSIGADNDIDDARDYAPNDHPEADTILMEPQHLIRLLSEDEVKAISLIWRAYRRHRSRRTVLTISTADAAVTSHYLDCLAEAQQMEWPHRFYRLLFLGPLPHALSCLQEIFMTVGYLKSDAKKRCRNAFHEDLEDAMSKQSQMNYLLKEVKRLQKALEPKSDMHRNRNLEQLKAHVQEIEPLIRRLPSGGNSNLNQNLKLAMRGIVEPNKPPSRKRKPNLCIEDDDDLYY